MMGQCEDGTLLYSHPEPAVCYPFYHPVSAQTNSLLLEAKPGSQNGMRHTTMKRRSSLRGRYVTLNTFRPHALPNSLPSFFIPTASFRMCDWPRQVHRLVAPRDQKYQSNFVEFRNNKIVYRRYAGLFFCACVDANDNELSYLEAIHFFVEVLDSFFGNVCELDLVFNFYKVCGISVIRRGTRRGEIWHLARNRYISIYMCCVCVYCC